MLQLNPYNSCHFIPYKKKMKNIKCKLCDRDDCFPSPKVFQSHDESAAKCKTKLLHVINSTNQQVKISQ